ncbi:MAG: tetratricopeptide repeat protein [Chitinophagaceae bacterium]|nr:tetratricopeptide repeat protein [Chitinophagaceae bacterium]
MKKMILLTLVAFNFLTVMAQGSKTAIASPHIKVFKQSVISGDVATAITALSYYVNEPGYNPVYEDTLAMLYMQQNSYIQCYYWADKRLKLKPEDLVLMEMKGICLDKLNQPKEAITVFEKLYSKTQSPYHAYTLMDLQYSIKRLAECLATAASTERLQFKPEYTITYNVGEQVGRTYLQAGIYNIQALALYDLDKKAEAKQYFEKALALDSNFVLARQNLDALKSLESGKNNVTPGNNNTPASPANKQN